MSGLVELYVGICLIGGLILFVAGLLAPWIRWWKDVPINDYEDAEPEDWEPEPRRVVKRRPKVYKTVKKVRRSR